MDPFRNPPADSLAAARLHVQALTECGLSREALLRALLENYPEGDAASTSTPTTGAEAGFPPQQAVQQGQQAVQGKIITQGHNTRLSVSTTSSKSSTGRTSILSTATSMSTVSSQGGMHEFAPAPTPPPAPPVKSSNRGSSKPQGAFWCTFCDVAFQRKFDWKRHEDEFHERYKRYPCNNCNRIFWGANTFNQHHKNAHGCTTCPHADRVVKYTHKKTAWACGFCGGFLASRDRYFDHVARHYEDGCNKSHWNHSLVIYGLLHQPSISQAWKELDAELYGHLPRNQQPMLEWDPKTTGHVQGFLEGEHPGGLQDLLEFFIEGRDDPKYLARLAHDSATIRLRSEIQPAAAPSPTPTSSTPRPISEPAKKHILKSSSPLTKHMSAPQRPAPPSPPSYGQPALKKQRSIAHLPSTLPSTFSTKNNPFFDQPNDQQPPLPPPPPQVPQQDLMSPFSPSPLVPTQGGFYDLTLTHVHPHMHHMAPPPQMTSPMTPVTPQNDQSQQQQQQQQPQQQEQQQLLQQQPFPPGTLQQQLPQQYPLSPMSLYDDWSSLAGTVVDESVFAGVMAMGWRQGDLGGPRHDGTG
ncbi:hypothetical protein VTI74DRAFT_11396 [Chaetomium olivicolor]